MFIRSRSACAVVLLLAIAGSACGAGGLTSAAASPTSSATRTMPAGVLIIRQEAIVLGTRKTGATDVKRSAAKLATYSDTRSAGVIPPTGISDSVLIWVVVLTATQGVCVAAIDAHTGDVYNGRCDAGTDWPPWFYALQDRAA